MAFNMKRPIIKGTPLHKASIAKAKESIVSQRRTQADASLVDAGDALGKSYIPAAIDYSIDQKAIKIPESNKDKGRDKKATKIKSIKKLKKLKVKDTSGPDLETRVPPETKKKEDRDKSGDKKATKIKPIKPGESKGKKGKGPDLETRVAPYVKEAEDEDIIEDAGLDDERTVDPNKKDRGYKNWKVREEERNIAAAEANKAKLDAKSKARKNKASKIEPKKIEQMPTTTPETKLEQAGPAPEGKNEAAKPAHLDPNLNNQVNSDIEGMGNFQTPKLSPHDQFAANLPEDAEDHFTSSYNDYAYTTVMTDVDGDGELDEKEIWTYKGSVINENQVSTAAHTSILSDLSGKQKQKYNKDIKQKETDLNSNTPSNDSTSVDLLPQPQTNTIAPTNTEQTLTPRQIRERKKQDKKYNDPNTGPNVKATMIEEGYNPIKSKNAEKMRDDRIYRNARKDGPVRRNMIKSGYEPE